MSLKEIGERGFALYQEHERNRDWLSRRAEVEQQLELANKTMGQLHELGWRSTEFVEGLETEVAQLRQQLADAQKDREEPATEARKAIQAVERHNILLDRGIGAVGKPVWAARATVNDVIAVGPWKRFVVDAILSLAQQLESEGAE
jgi:hypothetical protein